MKVRPVDESLLVFFNKKTVVHFLNNINFLFQEEEKYYALCKKI